MLFFSIIFLKLFFQKHCPQVYSIFMHLLFIIIILFFIIILFI